MTGTKIEVHLHKAEPGSWSSLDIPRNNLKNKPDLLDEHEDKAQDKAVDALDLDDIDFTPQKLTLSTEAGGRRTVESVE